MKSTAVLPGSTCGQRWVSSPSFERREGLRRARPRRGTRHRPARVHQGRDDRAIFAPTAAARAADVDDDHWRASLHRHAFQLAPGEEGDPLAVGREERLVRAFGPLQHGTVWLIDPPHREHRVPVWSRNRYDDRLPSGENATTPKALAGISPWGSRSNRTSGRSADCGRRSATVRPSAAAASTAAMVHGIQALARRSRSRFRVAPTDEKLRIADARESRFFGSFSRQRVRRRRAGAGTPVQSGSFVSTAATVSETVSLPKHDCPVSIS